MIIKCCGDCSSVLRYSPIVLARRLGGHFIDFQDLFLIPRLGRVFNHLHRGALDASFLKDRLAQQIQSLADLQGDGRKRDEDRQGSSHRSQHRVQHR